MNENNSLTGVSDTDSKQTGNEDTLIAELHELADILIAIFITLNDQPEDTYHEKSSDLCSSQHERAG